MVVGMFTLFLLYLVWFGILNYCVFRLLCPIRGGHHRALKTYGLRFCNICFEVLTPLYSGEARLCEAATAGPRRPHGGQEAGGGPRSSSKTGQYSFVPQVF